MGDIQYNGVTINVVMQAVSSTRKSMFADNIGKTLRSTERVLYENSI